MWPAWTAEAAAIEGRWVQLGQSLAEHKARFERACGSSAPSRPRAPRATQPQGEPPCRFHGPSLGSAASALGIWAAPKLRRLGSRRSGPGSALRRSAQGADDVDVDVFMQRIDSAVKEKNIESVLLELEKLGLDLTAETCQGSDVYAKLLDGALASLLDAGAQRAAVQCYQRWCWSETTRTVVSVSVREQVLHVLAANSQYLPAAAHVHDLLSDGDVDQKDAVALFNSILLGIYKSGHALTANRADQVLKKMEELGATPNCETLRVLVECKTLYAGPGFLMDVGQTVLNVARRFVGIPPDGGVLLAVSNSHLRAGDLEAAYRWFVASQLEERRRHLGDALELVSQLARGLAVGGQALRLLRVLKAVKADGGKLPTRAASVALAGYTAGRSLCTCWLEPPADVVRRRGVWASGNKVQVKCAEQWNWQKLEESRHEVHQWHPYLSPDTKVERAWLAPLRSLDVNGLGLVRDWCGETPAQATARERLGDRGPTPPLLDMKSALCVEPPGAGPDASRSFFSVAERSRSRPVARLPNPRTWRIFHADAVKRAYGNANRRRVPSPSHLRQHLLAEKSSQLLLGARPVATPLQIPYKKLKEIIGTLTTEEKETLIHFKESRFSKASKEELQQALTDAKIDADLAGSTSEAVKSLVKVAAAMAKGQPYLERLTDEEYVEAVEKMSEEELQEAWKFLCSERSTEIMGTKLSTDVEEKLLSELQEDEQLDGSAEDELQLALEILATLRDVGVKPTAMDCKALLQAAHALGDVDLAGKVMESVAGSLAEQEEPEEGELGPAGQAMLQVMEDGGWDRDASEDFLKGKRVFTRRDPETSLGKMQTRYLDPLLGAEASEPYAKDRDDLLQAFTKPYTGKITPFNRKSALKQAQDEDDDADSMNEKSERRQSVTWTSQKKDEASEETVEEKHVVTRSDILIAGVQHPEEAAALVALAGRDSKGLMYNNSSVLREHLDRLGLTPPTKPSASKKLLAFAVEVLSEAAETRAMVA
ncbi:unnamed protein product [Symbiodinium sp. CCMP2592]|nr:unnamed protein product [Symbiodinium sp. CCMP2592]